MKPYEGLTEKYLFDRQKAIEVCHEHYRARGYSEQHCHDTIDWLEDEVVEYVYKTILKEREDARRNGNPIF